MKNLATENHLGEILPIESIDIPICIDCEKKITEENDSGWERFREDGKTQKICKNCDEKNKILEMKHCPRNEKIICSKKIKCENCN